MKKFAFKFLTKNFSKELRQQVEDWYLSQEFPNYKINNKDEDVKSKLTELWYDPEFKMWLKMLSNKRNYLKTKLMNAKHTTKDEDIIESARIQGRALEISDQFAFLKYIRRLFQSKEKSNLIK